MQRKGVKMNTNFAPIGITGLKQAGKNTIAEIIRENHIRTCRIVGFADPLRDIGKVFNFSEEEMFEEKNKINETWNMSWRQFAQTVGTDIFRNKFSTEVWLKLANVEILKHPSKICIFADVRFYNEAQFIKELGGKVIWVNRPNEKQADKHESEKGIPTSLIDFGINNIGTIKELEGEVLECMKMYSWFSKSATTGENNEQK